MNAEDTGPDQVEPPEVEELLTTSDEAALADAVAVLEGSSFAASVSALLGRRFGMAGSFVPARVAEAADAAATKALDLALRAAAKTLPHDRRPASRRLHLAAVTASGAFGGAFGLAALPIELPVSTSIILRAVADIARAEGEDLDRPEAVLACLEVFALGASEHGGGALGESSYFAIRALLAKSLPEAARYMVQRGLGDEVVPAAVKVFAQIASRFGVIVSQKLMAQAVPVLGAIAGAAINAVFMDHYQKLARAHFVVRRLERQYRPATVRRAYERLRQGRAGAREDRQRGSPSEQRSLDLIPEPKKALAAAPVDNSPSP